MTRGRARKGALPWVCLGLAALLAAGCDGGSDDAGPDGDADSDGDVGADGDLDGDADGDEDLHDGDAEETVPPTEADEARLAGVVEELAADEMLGRLTGTPSGDAAEALVRQLLEDTGIEVATQDVTFPLFEVAGPAELSLLGEGDEPTATFAYIDDFREVDFSGSGRVVGDLFFAGYGIVHGEYDSFEGVDLEGKIAVMLTDVPPGEDMTSEDQGRLDLKIHEAFERGAVGVIFVPAGDQADRDRDRPLEMELFAQDKYGDFHAELHHAEMPVAFVHVRSVESLLGVRHAALVTDPSGRDLGRRARLEIRGTVHAEAACRNVFGIMRGTDPDVGDEVVILGGHYDHIGVGADGRIFNGASDNASGAAIVLETATTLFESGMEPRRTVLFALWCAEEQGLWGSLEYAVYGSPLFPLSDTRLMIQVDYIGEEDGPYLTNVDDYDLLWEFLGEEDYAPELPVDFLFWGGGCASDDCPFLWMEVPAYRFISYGSYHHLAEDDFENVNVTMIDRVADVCIRGVGRVAF